MKKKKFKQIKSRLLNLVHKFNAGKMRDRRLRRSKEKQSVTEGWE